jgi:small subunit ribosomal protein S2
VGTKRQAQSAIAEEAGRCEMPYVNQRWIGGLLTNFATIRKSLKIYNDLCEKKEGGGYGTATKKEALMLERKRTRFEKSMGGIRTMRGIPSAVFIVDSRKESIAIREARKLDIPVVAIVDTNCDPDEVDHIIPGNDDAIRAIKLFSQAVADACAEGSALYQESLQAASDKEEAEKAREERAPAVAVEVKKEAREQAPVAEEVEKAEEAEEAPEEGEKAPQG